MLRLDIDGPDLSRNSRPFPVRAQQLAVVSGGLVLFVAAAVLLGWVFDIRSLKSIWPTGTKMADQTALAFLFAGLALTLASLNAFINPRSAPGRSSAGRWLWQVSAALVLLMGVGRLLELWIARGSILPRVSQDSPDSVQMGPATAGAFIVLGGALLLSRGSRLILFQALATLGGLVGWLGLSQQLFGGEPILPYTRMAIDTSLLFVVLSARILCLRTDAGLIMLLTTKSLGGMASRRLLPAALLVPTVLQWLR